MDLFKFLFEKTEKWFYKPLFLPIIFLLVFVGLLYAPAPAGINLSFEIHIIVSLIAALAVTLACWYFQQPPTMKNGCIGINIAIKSEDEKTKARISKDFVETCKNILYESRVNQPFQLIELNDSLAKLATDNVSANQLRIRCKGHLLIFGDTVQRQEKRKELYVLRLRGLVSHIPANQNTQPILALEMDAGFP